MEVVNFPISGGVPVRERRETDFIFARYPLWIRYSGLPDAIGGVALAIFMRLLELMERFESNKFFYPMEKLCKTTGIATLWGMKKILKRLVDQKLIKYTTHRGRSQATEFEIILPLNTPIPEEDVYRLNPRLRSKSYQKRVEDEIGGEKNYYQGALLKNEGKNYSNGALLGEKNYYQGALLKGENYSNGALLKGKNYYQGAPNKKDIYKKDNNKKDLSQEKEKNPETGKIEDTPDATMIPGTKIDEVVVAVDINKLKEYGISGGDAEKFLKKFSQAYLGEKIEIIEFKISNGDEIRNVGGMLKKAIMGDWQPPPGFTTRTQREQEARQKKEAEEAAAHAVKEEEEREKREREQQRIVEEWKRTASPGELEELKARAKREVMGKFPEGDERWMGPMFRQREYNFIAEEYANDERKVRKER